MSSSSRKVPPCDGVLKRDQQPIGPMRMPANRSSDFVAHFNRIYGEIGLSIAAIERASAGRFE